MPIGCLLASCSPATFAPPTRQNTASVARGLQVGYDYAGPVVPSSCDVYFGQQNLGQTREYGRGGFVVPGSDVQTITAKLDDVIPGVLFPKANAKTWKKTTTKQKVVFATKTWSASGRNTWWKRVNAIVVQEPGLDAVTCLQWTN